MLTKNNYERNKTLPELEIILDLLIDNTLSLNNIIPDIEAHINGICKKIETQEKITITVADNSFCDAAVCLLKIQNQLILRLKAIEQSLSEISPYRINTISK